MYGTHVFVLGKLLQRALRLLYHIVEKKQQIITISYYYKLGPIYSCELINTEDVTLY